MRVCTTRVLATALAFLLCCTPELVLAASGQATAKQQPSAAQTNSAPSDSSQPANSVPDAPQPAAANAPPQSGGQNNPSSQQQQAQQPEGTAAARAARTIGGPASKPAGSAIAPAKQRQTRSLLIKIGAIVGVGATVGTVYALTRGTPTRPPGAH